MIKEKRKQIAREQGVFGDRILRPLLAGKKVSVPGNLSKQQDEKQTEGGNPEESLGKCSIVLLERYPEARRHFVWK